MIAMFLVPKRFHDKNGRGTDMVGHDRISVWGEAIA